MLNHFLTNAKAYAALLGSGVSVLLATAAPGSTLFTVLTIASVMLTAIGTWRVPNLTDVTKVVNAITPAPKNEAGLADTTIVAISVAVIATVSVLTFFGVHGR